MSTHGNQLQQSAAQFTSSVANESTAANISTVEDSNFQTIKFMNDNDSVITTVKRVYPINKALLLNRWVPPCVALNDDLYVKDQSDYDTHYTIVKQKDIVKPTNYMEEYQNIQVSLSIMGHPIFTKFTFKHNKAFYVVDFCSGNVYECRILYAYYNDASNKNVNNISWRVYVDNLKVNMVMTTFLVKRLICSTYSNYMVQLIMILPHNQPKKERNESKHITPSKSI